MLIERARALTLGSGLDEQTQVGPVINERQCKKILDYIRIGQQEGARLALGGNRRTDGELAHGYFIEPTIFTDVQPTMRIWREEIFGPVLSVAKAESFEHAIALANDSDFGGIKNTGNGHREGGWTVFDIFTEWKTVYVDFSGRLQRAQIDTE
jgi:aldehyde dehydrogenase (NAD+)